MGFAASRLHVHVVEEDALEIVLVIIVVVVFIVVLFLLLVLVGVVELVVAVVVAVLARTAAILVFFLILATESIRLKILLAIVAFPASLVRRRALRYLTLQTPLPVGSAASLAQLCTLTKCHLLGGEGGLLGVAHLLISLGLAWVLWLR